MEREDRHHRFDDRDTHVKTVLTPQQNFKHQRLCEAPAETQHRHDIKSAFNLSFHVATRRTFNVDPDTHIDSLEQAEQITIEGTSKWSCKIAITGLRWSFGGYEPHARSFGSIRQTLRLTSNLTILISDSIVSLNSASKMKFSIGETLEQILKHSYLLHYLLSILTQSHHGWYCTALITFIDKF